MPISRHTSLLAIAALAATLAVAGPAAAADEVKFATPQAAFEQGLGAYKSGYFEIARPALEHAARTAEGDARFLAEYYLARLYADNAGSQTNHARAYEIYQRIADENADIDPEDGLRAPIVAKVLTALAGYVRAGLPAIGLHADESRAIEYLEFAATFFNDKDAQFELAKIYLGAAEGSSDIKRGTHNLAVLAQEGHAGAQAFLADLHWRGKIVPKYENRALALITMAMENAPSSERIWIEDIYQNVYCGSSPYVRKSADGIVAVWKRMFTPQTGNGDRRMALGARELEPERRCANGEAVDTQRFGPGRYDGQPAIPLSPQKGGAIAVPPATGLRDINTRERGR